MNRVVRGILGTISGLLLIYGVVCVSLASGYSALGPCVGAPVGMCPSGSAPAQITVSLPANSAPLVFAAPLLLLAFVIGIPVWIGTVTRAERRDSSARPVILIVSLLASALLMVDMFILLSQIPMLSANEVCLGGAVGQASPCLTGTHALLAALAGVGWAPLVGAVIAGAPAWVMTLAQTARWRRWGWFTAALLFSPLAALLYAVLGPSRPESIAPASPAAPEPAPAV